MTMKVAIKMHPVPRSVLRAAVVGEYLATMGLSDSISIRGVQQAVNEGLVTGIIVVGFTSTGIPKDRNTLAIKKLEQDDKVMLDLSDGKSHIEALDVTLAGAISWACDRAKRLNLTPRFYLDWSAEARADPANLAAACRRLNLVMDGESAPAPVDDLFSPPSTYTTRSYAASTYAPSSPSYAAPASFPSRSPFNATPPPLPSGYAYKPGVTVTPAKDKGLTFTSETARRT